MKYFNLNHVITWILYSLLLYLIYKFVVRIDESIEHTFIFVILQLLVFYINLSVLLPKVFNKKRFVLFGALNIILIITFSFGNTLLEGGLPQNTFENHNTFEALLAHSVPVFIGIFTAFMLYTYNQQLDREEKEKTRIIAEKNFLVQQINPHFLFNTLNNIYSLTLENNPKGSEAVMQLSKMLDYSLYGNQQEYVTLKNEVQYIDNFIDLFKLKDDSLTNIYFDYTKANLDFSIAPMLLLPFIENAFKHGDIETEEGTIDVNIETKGNSLEFNCENSFSEIKKVDRTGGIGINNVKRRLELLYPEEHHLIMEKNNGIFKVILKITVNEA